MTSSMAWYPLPQSGGKMAAGDEFFDNQPAGWSLWSFSTPDDLTTTGPSEEDRSDEGPAPFEEPGFTQPTDEIFLSQFSDEEMFPDSMDMFPDSMHRLLSYENMLTGALTGSEEGDATMLERNGVDTLDTCGFPLFSHDLQNESKNPDMLLEEDKAGLSMAKRSRTIADTENTPGFEALELEELEDVVFQLTKRTRICYRDAFYRLAESSKANCSTANGNYSASRQSFQQPNGNASRFSTTPDCPERETNPIDRTVMVLTMKPPPPPQLHGDDSGPEAQSTTSWTTRASEEEDELMSDLFTGASLPCLQR